MNEYKVSYCYSSPHGIAIEGKQFLRATSEQQAKSIVEWVNRKRINLTVLNIKRTGN